MLNKLIEKNRSYRRFQEDYKIRTDLLEKLIDLARLSASGTNLQSLKYIISNSAKLNQKIFPHLAWAGYLTDWSGPLEGERPSAYIIILGDKNISQKYGVDPGIAAQSILLGATEKNLGGCMIGAIKREKLAVELNLDNNFEILLVLAIGRPIEKVVIDEIEKGESIKYWRDENQIHHVPKRKLEDIIIRDLNE